MTNPNKQLQHRKIDTLNEQPDWMIPYRFQIEDVPDILAYKYSRYPSTYVQYGSYDSQQTAKQVHQFLKQEFPRMSFHAIVIVKRNEIPGIASYNYVKNELFVREELSDPENFNQLVNEAYFPARNLHDVLMHEIGGHKRHWQSVYAYYNQNFYQFRDVLDAKNVLEINLRSYVKKKDFLDQKWITNTVSRNAYLAFKYSKRRENRLNELIADAIVLKDQRKLKDSRLWRLIEEVISYD